MERFDVSEVDHTVIDGVLATTRAVRRRLDLARPVDHQLILDCIDLAEQAPTGGNQGSRRWVVVRDPYVKQQLAELNRRVAGQWMIDARDRIAGTGHPDEVVMASAAQLAEHLEQVPVIVVPTIIGRHDGSGRPGLFDSVMQSAWSFCLALRARGLGTAWTTSILSAEEELAAVLGLPPEVTPIALLPVAWTVGTDFSPARRLAARDITFVDGFGRTYERGPSDPPTLADGPGTMVEIDIAAPTETVWALVTDIDLPARFSPELQGATWDEPFTGPGLGARFTGRNRHKTIGEWSVPCFVDRFDDGRTFGWCTSSPDEPGARWWFELEPIAGRTRLRYRLALGSGRSGLTDVIESMPDKEHRILGYRLAEHRTNMIKVVEGIAAAGSEADDVAVSGDQD